LEPFLPLGFMDEKNYDFRSISRFSWETFYSHAATVTVAPTHRPIGLLLNDENVNDFAPPLCDSVIQSTAITDLIVTRAVSAVAELLVTDFVSSQSASEWRSEMLCRSLTGRFCNNTRLNFVSCVA